MGSTGCPVIRIPHRMAASGSRDSRSGRNPTPRGKTMTTVTSAPALDPDSGLIPLDRLPGVGKRHAENLARLGIGSVNELLLHYPVRWVDRRELRSLGSLTAADGTSSEPDENGKLRKSEVTALGSVVGCRVVGARGYRRRSFRDRLEVVIQDDSGHLALVFFGGGWRKDHFKTGVRILVSGTLGTYRNRLQMQNPDYEILNREEEEAIHTGSLFPVYPLTRGLGQRQLRVWVRRALEDFMPPDPLPASFQTRIRVVSLSEALSAYHFPRSPEHRESARRRLAFEELFFDQLLVYAARLRREHGMVSFPIRADGRLYRRVLASLPFSLTPDQERATKEILADMSTARPANRLLQGDVGSGKTVVAFLIAAAAADAGLQTAFMVPTEILAEQHQRSLTRLGGEFGLSPRLLVGSQSRPARRETLRVLADGTAPLVVGTHALFQDEVRFGKLGLVVVDEQHRFGVMQRLALMQKGKAAHLLAMTATPIPRSLAMVRYADLDLSVLMQRPSGRGKIITRVTGEENREKVYSFLAKRLGEGRQAYVIYPLVQESEKTDLKAATTMAQRLSRHPEFRGYETALLHGQMKSEEKEAIMRRFVEGEIHILVATTVVEVGIDVPNASFLIIEHPERYGLSQLHQLRGRIGRGPHTSYCVLVRDDSMDSQIGERLKVFSRTDDGFELARMDLLMRGQGDLIGTRQSGRPECRLADPVRDLELIKLARKEARKVLDAGTLLTRKSPEWKILREKLKFYMSSSFVTDAG